MNSTTQIVVFPKGLHAIIDAVESKLAWFDRQIEECTDENELADLGNDSAVLRIQLKELKKEAAEREAEWAKERGGKV